MSHSHEPKIYPPECTRAAAHLRKLKGHDNPSKLIIAEAEDALTRAALELHFLETLMRTATQLVTDLLADDKKNRADLADAESANAEFKTALDTLQAKYDALVANPPVANPDDVIAADNPARVEADALLGDPAVVSAPVIQQ